MATDIHPVRSIRIILKDSRWIGCTAGTKLFIMFPTNARIVAQSTVMVNNARWNQGGGGVSTRSRVNATYDPIELTGASRGAYSPLMRLSRRVLAWIARMHSFSGWNRVVAWKIARGGLSRMGNLRLGWGMLVKTNLFILIVYILFIHPPVAIPRARQLIPGLHACWTMINHDARARTCAISAWGYRSRLRNGAFEKERLKKIQGNVQG